VIHIRSFFGIGSFHWFIPFGLILCLVIPQLVARRELTGPLDYIRESEAWGQAFFGSRPTWMKRTTWVLFAYFMVFFLILVKKNYPNTFFWDSGHGLPAPIAQFFSTGWMFIDWEFACTFWLALYPDSRHVTFSSSK
jgi:preprotein translocase subunit SecG